MKLLGEKPISEYEKWREERIKRNKELLDSLFPDLKETKQKLKSSLSMKRTNRRKSAPYERRAPAPLVIRRNPDRKVRTSSCYTPENAIVQKSTDSCQLTDDYWEGVSKIRIGRIMEQEKTEIVLDPDRCDVEAREPAYNVMDKIYDRNNGTTCHQCRQKTLDGKTRCNNKLCRGVRGQFCGVCLLNRYGEDAKAAINDKTWVCPVCRGFCNCSLCLSRIGKRPTGVLTPLALAEGYKSVKDYLAQYEDERKPDEINIMETDEEEGEKEGMEGYDDENKENIDPNKRNKKRDKLVLSVPLKPISLLITRDTNLGYQVVQEQNIDIENTKVDKMIISPKPKTPTKNTKYPSKKRQTPCKTPPRKTIKRCLVQWKTTKYAGGLQWLSPEKVTDLDQAVPQLGNTVKVKWGKSAKLTPAILKEIEYDGRQRKSTVKYTV